MPNLESWPANGNAVNLLATSVEQRRDLYKLLSECYYLPDKTLVEKMGSFGPLKGSFSDLSDGFPSKIDLSELKIDYSRLFVGPYALLAPPYGSVYLENAKTVMGETTINARNWYEKECLHIGLKEAPDHIALELEFMYFLVYKEEEAITYFNVETTEGYRKKQKAFLHDHLARWVFQFAAGVEANARTTFYRNVARLTRSFVKEDFERLSNHLDGFSRCGER